MHRAFLAVLVFLGSGCLGTGADPALDLPVRPSSGPPQAAQPDFANVTNASDGVAPTHAEAVPPPGDRPPGPGIRMRIPEPEVVDQWEWTGSDVRPSFEPLPEDPCAPGTGRMGSTLPLATWEPARILERVAEALGVTWGTEANQPHADATESTMGAYLSSAAPRVSETSARNVTSALLTALEPPAGMGMEAEVLRYRISGEVAVTDTDILVWQTVAGHRVRNLFTLSGGETFLHLDMKAPIAVAGDPVLAEPSGWDTRADEYLACLDARWIRHGAFEVKLSTSGRLAWESRAVGENGFSGQVDFDAYTGEIVGGFAFAFRA